MERKPTMYIGKQPWYITFIGVDKATGEIRTEETETPAQSIERLDEAMSYFGYARREKKVTSDGVAT